MTRALGVLDARLRLRNPRDPGGSCKLLPSNSAEAVGGSKCLLERRNRLEKAIKASDFPGLDLVPADFSLRSLVLELNGLNNPLARIARLLRPLRNDYDLVLIDCAPGVSLVSDAVMRASDLVLVPTIPTTLSLCTYALLVDHAKAKTLDAPLVPFFSMANRRWRLHREIMIDFARRLPECSRIFIPTQPRSSRWVLGASR